WLENEARVSANPAIPSWTVKEDDARLVEIPLDHAVVSEGYLGQNQTHSPSAAEYEDLKDSLTILYRECLAHWRKDLPVGAEITITLPYWKTTDGMRGLP